jgi:hypothetical protein
MTFLKLFCLAASLLAMCGIAAGQSDRFVAKSLTEIGGFRLRASLERVFPLFGPIKEKLWAAGWDPRPLYPMDQDVAEGMVFTVQEPHGLVYWVVTQYDPANHLIAYINVAPENVVNRITVRCRAAGSNETDVSVAYQHTALGETGNRWIATLTQEKYEAKMRHWKEAIEYALEHDSPMPVAH